MGLECELEILRGVIQVITSIIVDQQGGMVERVQKSVDKIRKCRRTQNYFNNTFSYLFKEVKAGSLSFDEKDQREVRMVYKTYNSNSYELISEQLWCFSIEKSNVLFSGNKQKSDIQLFWKGILAMTANYSPNNLHKKLGAFTNYQILEPAKNQIEKSLQSSTNYQFQQNGYLIKINITQLLKSSHAQVVSQQQPLDRKLSTETNCTLSRKSVKSRSRSIFSYYDEESEVTILSEKKEGFGCQLEEESILVGDDEEEEEPEWILDEQDLELEVFKSSLREIKQLANTSFNLLI